MSIRGITFSKQIVSSNDDSHIYKMLFGNRNGKTKGCLMNYDVDNIYISNGFFLAANRLIEIASTEIIQTPVVSTVTTYFRLVFEIDLSKANTTAEFNQGYFKLISSTTDYPEIVQEDLENGGSIYQLPFAKFTKTISGIQTFNIELETIAIPESKTIYVSTSGSDAAGDGTESKPYKTIQHAINSISHNIGNQQTTIHVASGTYQEDVVISGFYGGIVRLTFGSVTIKSLTAYETCVYISGDSLTIAANGKTYGIYLHRAANVISQIPITINGATNGIYATFGSTFAGNQAIVVNSCTYAISAMYTAHVYISSLAGSKNNNGIQAIGGIVSLGSIAAGVASTAYITGNGGRIYTGSQSNIPAY